MSTFSTLTKIRNQETSHVTLESLAAELTRMQETKKDYVIDTRRMSLVSDEAKSELIFDAADGHTIVGPVNDHAHGQIAARLQIPKRYYDRLRADAPKLLDTNVQHWFYEKPERRMVRTLDGNVRAFMSDRYRRLDNFDLMERSVIPALHDIDGLSFHVASLTPERMVLRVVLPSVQAEVLSRGDIVQAGFQCRNSEVGASAFTIEPFIWKLDCLNGLVINASALKATHIGRRVDDSDEALAVFRDDTIRADDTAFFLKARDAIKASVDQQLFDEAVELMRQAATGIEIMSPVASTQTLASTFDLNDGEASSVLASLARGGDLSRWGLVNAVTDAAKSADTFDRQEEMERVGGQLLAMPQDDWQKLALVG